MIGLVPGHVLEIRYKRYGAGVGRGMSGFYKHPFKARARILAMSDGSLRIVPVRRGKRLWVRLPH